MAKREDQLRRAVRERYAAVARAFLAGGEAGCCGPAVPGEACCGTPFLGGRDADGKVGTTAYDTQQLTDLPAEVVGTSLGCGNPVALASLRPGEQVLDLGCGGGLDLVLAARAVQPGGRVYGLDQSDEMLDLARRNLAAAGVGDAVLLKGDLESVPLPRGSVDVILSNCVINLSTEKTAALAEAFRVLRPGGRLAVSDVVLTRPLPPWAEPLRDDLAAWAGCLAGALTLDAYRALLTGAGFTDVEVEVVGVYPLPDERLGPFRLAPERRAELEGIVASASIRARKPADVPPASREA